MTAAFFVKCSLIRSAFMKKIFSTFIIAFGILFSAAAQKAVVKIDTNYEMPDGPSKNAFVFDATDLKGKGISKIRVINYTEYRNITFEVFVHSAATKQWDSLGKANLRAFADRTDVGNKYPSLGKMRYFAIVPSEKEAGNNYLFNPTKSRGKVANAPLLLEVRRPEDGLDMTPKPVLNEPHSYVLAESEIPDDSDENISVINRTSAQAISMKVFGYHKKELKWIPLGSIVSYVNVVGGKNKGVLEMEQYDINEFYYFGFAVNGKKDYGFAFQNKNDDICVTLTDLE